MRRRRRVLVWCVYMSVLPETDERRLRVQRRLDETWIDVGAFVRNAERDRYEWHDAGWLSWIKRRLFFLNRRDSVPPYWWPLSTPLADNAMLARRLHILYRVVDRRIVQFVEIEM